MQVLFFLPLCFVFLGIFHSVFESERQESGVRAADMALSREAILSKSCRHLFPSLSFSLRRCASLTTFSISSCRFPKSHLFFLSGIFIRGSHLIIPKYLLIDKSEKRISYCFILY